MELLLVFCLVIIIIISLILFVLFKKNYLNKQLDISKEQAKFIIERASEEAKNIKSSIILEAKEEAQKFKENIENEVHERLKDIQFREKHLIDRENILDEKNKQIDSLVKKHQEDVQLLNQELEKLESLKNDQLSELEKISNLTLDQAKNIILDKLNSELSSEKASIIIDFEQQIKKEKEKISREIVSNVIQRCSSEYVSESTVSVINLPNDNVKGCIIGREGRNIRSIESLTGVDLIIDDSPSVIAVSSFDPYKREIAKNAIEMLISDGRIHPSKIEEMVEKATKEIDGDIQNEGQRTVIDLQIRNINYELINLIGQLKYRTSYGQNALKHSIEVANISSLLASELGMDPTLSRRCGLLHDIGKSLTYKVDGSHVEVGVKILRKYGESEEVIDAVASHHGDCKPKTIDAILVQAADSISASRPGASKENFENYVKRIRDLESLVNQFEFVERCYAIQAGREVRVIVSPLKISDDEMVLKAREICKKIEENLSYPGQIRINMIRENRVVEYAR